LVSALVACIAASLVALALTPIVRAWARRAGVVDAPGGRRVHREVTPRLGGVAVMAGFFAALVALAIAKSVITRGFMGRTDLLFGLVLGALVVGLVGAVDDVRGLGPWYKLAAQTVAAAIAYAFGYRIDAVNLPLIGDVDMGMLSLPVTVLWFLAITNAINLIDGLDGLAAGISLFATIANGAIAYSRGSESAFLLSAALGGSLLGFLRYNFNPATIFLGDSGSMFLGFTLAATSIGGQLTKSSTAVVVLAPMLAMGVPIVDTLLAMIRRTVAKQSIFAADRGHIHHRLLDLGLTHRRVVLTLYAASVALAVGAVAVAVGHSDQIGGALAVIAVVLFVLVRGVARQRAIQLQRLADRTRALAVVDERSQELAERLSFVSDEASIRALLAEWSTRIGTLSAVLVSGEGADEEHGVVFSRDVSAPGRRRSLRISVTAELAHDPPPPVSFDRIANACAEAVSRGASRSGATGRFATFSPTVVGSKD
jgi:UDP-GlcNAc:undecaprenyl-phosphate/decaprenyl-phosphate GlcNAc-1-phosphate transferase